MESQNIEYKQVWKDDYLKKTTILNGYVASLMHKVAQSLSVLMTTVRFVA